MRLFKKKNNKLDYTHELLSEIAHFTNLAKNSAWYYSGNDEIVTSLFTGQLLVVDRRDLSLSPHLILRGEWELELTRLFREMINDGDVIFDIGANVGYYGTVGSTENGDGKIYFFEANSKLASMIEKSNNINGIEHRSTVVAKAVSNHSNQQLTLYVHDQLMGGSTLANDKVELLGSKNFKPVIVDTVSVDDFCDSTGQVKCDIVKIDVENYEEQVLKGMKKTIQRNANIKILMEYTKGAYSGEFWPLLEDTFSHISAYVEGMGFVDLNTEADLTKLMPGDWYKGWTMLLLRNS